MAERLEIYKCNICGNLVEVLRGGNGKLVCCGEDMRSLKENDADASREKHAPVIEKTEGGFLVKVGSAPHPMEEKHFIEWIELISGGKAYREFLKPGQAPEAFFNLSGEITSARAHCNLHGLWKG